LIKRLFPFRKRFDLHTSGNSATTSALRLTTSFGEAPMRHSFRLGLAFVYFLFTLGVAVLAAGTAYGQASTSAGAIQGTISDPNGAVLPGSTVALTNLDTSARKVLTTDSAGFYSIASLVPGRYQLVVSAENFAKVSTTLTVQIGTVTNGDLKLKIGKTSEQVIVSTDTLQVNTSQSTVEGVLTSQQIDNLPISGRNFLDLSQLEPGVQLQSGETFDPTNDNYYVSREDYNAPKGIHLFFRVGLKIKF
jgi:hypothetical protein